MSAIWECPHCFGKDGHHAERCHMRHVQRELAAPTIHSNGTGWKDLYEQMETATHAVGAAINAVMTASPNGRDYYVQSPGATEAAIAEHRSRLERLLGVKAELEAIWIKVVDQEPRRR